MRYWTENTLENARVKGLMLIEKGEQECREATDSQVEVEDNKMLTLEEKCLMHG